MTTEYKIKSPRKLIEVALPLDAINAACKREKSIRHGHPSTLHLWWARRPLAAARAVIFAQLVNDPGFQQGDGFKYGVNKAEAAKERQRLFGIIEELVKWENTNNEKVLEAARAEIRRSWREVCDLNKDHPEADELFNPEKMPGLHDPFAGGGAIPLEAQRLGLEAYASDLNPVPILINKAMIEIPPKFADRSPVNPEYQDSQNAFEKMAGAQGLAEDVRYYGQWMRDEAEKRIGDLYPKVEVAAEMAKDRPDLEPYVGEQLTVIAWLWARTVKSPNPAFSHVDVPLASTFILSKKKGKEAYVQPVIEGDKYHFEVKVGSIPEEAKAGTKLARGANFKCIVSAAAIEPDYVKGEGKAGRMGQRLMAIVAEGNKGRVYLPPIDTHETVTQGLNPIDATSIHVPIANEPRALWCLLYGLTHFDHLFTDRQLVALTTFSDLATEIRQKIKADAIAAGWEDDKAGLDAGGTTATAYAEAVSVYLAFAVDKCSDRNSSICSWDSSRDSIRGVFGRQAIPMVWDFAEADIVKQGAGSYFNAIRQIIKCLSSFNSLTLSVSKQVNAAEQTLTTGKFVSTDPPYYDNIGYADLSDFFYVWLRRSLRDVFPNLLATISVPKAEELIAAPHRQGSKEAAEEFFLDGMAETMSGLARQAHPSAPVTIYYAFKSSETKDGKTTSTGWVTFLEAVLRSGFSLSGTWPFRTELSNRMVSSGTNALASSVVLVCRKRPADAPTISRREFIRELNETLPEAHDEMTGKSLGQSSPVTPVDMSQAIIGPGMAIFSKYEAVLEADGTPMTVKTALQLINRFLAEDVFDSDTQFCLAWFEEFGWKKGDFGQADTLARAKNSSVDGIAEAGVITSGAGEVQLKSWKDYETDWDPESDSRIPAWELLHHLIRLLQISETAAADVLAHEKVVSLVPATRQLAYRLYTLCERKGWAEEARPYNELIASWDGIEVAAAAAKTRPEKSQQSMFE